MRLIQIDITAILTTLKPKNMHLNIKTISIQMATLAIVFFPMCYKPIAAHAMTADEFLRMMGVLGRYSDDINRTFRPNQQPNPTPSPEPAQPQPNQQDTVPVPLDQPIEQLPNFN